MPNKDLRVFAMLLAAALLLGALSGCGAPKGGDGEKISVVTTIFPAYDWVTQVIGSRAGQADVTMLLDSGVDLHSYQPAADDIVALSRCDLFVYVGGESDEWVDDALKEAVNQDMIVLDLMDILGADAKEEELVEGMEPEDEDEDEPAYDEHVWLSLKNAETFCFAIAEALAALDPAGADAYEKNAAAYAEELRALDGRYADAAASAGVRTLLFGDRFPFRYLADDYGLSYYAAFPGCSAETEASFETIVFLAAKVDELGLPAVLTIDGSDGRIARTIVEATASRSARVLTMDSMQSVTADDVRAGASYLGIMEQDLAVLTEATR